MAKKPRYHDVTKEELVLNIERYRFYRISPATGKSTSAKEMAALLGDANHTSYSKWVNHFHDEIRESNGQLHLSQNKRMALNKYFSEYKVSISWLFTYGTDEEFLAKIDMANYAAPDPEEDDHQVKKNTENIQATKSI